MKRKFTPLLIAGLLSLSLLAGCGKKDAETPTEVITTTESAVEEDTEAAATAADAEGTAAQDRAGNDIILPAKVDKIVSMAPSTTRFLIDIGAADKIVAIDTNSYAYADQLAADIPQFDMMAPDNEALVALEPDIIFTSGMSNVGGEDAFKAARDAGICVFDIPSSPSLDDIANDMVAIGNAIGMEDETNKIVNEYNDKIAEIQEIAKNITDKKKVLFEISLPSSDYPSIYTFGKNTYLDEMITTIGAENITGDQESWISISEEEAIAMNPDVIVTNVNYIDDAVNVIKTAPGWENVTAIQNGAVYYIDADASNQPNQHVIDAMIQMAKQIYPDEYATFDDPFATSGDAE